MKLKKIFSMITAVLCGINICFTGGQFFVAEAANSSEKLQYGDYLRYNNVDEDEDGNYDYVVITDCALSATEIEIPSEIDGLPVTSIGNYAFSYCESLTSVTIPDSVTSIEHGAFSGCYALTSITIPDSVTSIGDSAFYGCESLTSITIPNSVTSIGMGVFKYCKILKSITIGNRVTSIDSETFMCCESLTSITIPDSVTSISPGTFYDCKSLTNITIPKSVTSIGHSAFSNTPWLRAKQVENPLVIVNNILIDGTTCSGDVIIPDSVTSIGDYAFYNCDALASVTIPDSVTSIGDSAFSDCESLTSVTIPDSVTSIGDSAFQWCNSITSITIPDSVTSIGDRAFSGCYALTSITIPNSVTSIGHGAFSNTLWLRAKQVENPLVIVNNILIDGTTCSGDMIIPDSVISISNFAFMGCQFLTSITIPNSITSIGYYVFDACESIKNITIENPECAIGILPDTATIYGYNNSTAHEYAEKYGRNFVALDEAPAVTTTVPVVTSVTSYISVPQTESIISTRGTAPTTVATTTVTTTTTKSTTVSVENTTANNENVYLSKSELEMIVGDRITIKVNNFDGNVTWTSSDSSIAVVKNGQIEAISKGKAVIFAMLGETSYLCCNITVEENEQITTAENDLPATTTTTVSQQEIDDVLYGDANKDGELNVRDCAFIANRLAGGNGHTLPDLADFNQDGDINIRDAAAICAFLAKNDNNIYPYELLNMNAQKISNVLGNCSYSIFNSNGQCYQVTSNNYPGLHILFADLSVSEDFKLNAVPTDIVITQGSASDRLYCGMSLSECFEINGNQKLYINAHDSKLSSEITYNEYIFIVQFDSSYYDISNEDYVAISAERTDYYLKCNPKISKIHIKNL